MDCRSQVSCSGLWEFVVPYSNPFILKKKTFSRFFIQFMESPSNLKHFQKKEYRHSRFIFEISDRPRLGRATHYSAPSQNIFWQSTCYTVPKPSKILMRALLPYFSVTVRRNNLENISLTEVWNRRVGCYHIDCRSQVSCSGLCEFAVPYSNPVILKIKNIFRVFYCIYGISFKIRTFSKKGRSS